MRIACCPGTYDPVTNGHLDVITRTAACFDKVIVAVVSHPSKRPLFPLAERVEMLDLATKNLAFVEVKTFSGLLAEFAQAQDVTAMVRGLRAVSDFDYELQMAQMNYRLTEVETLFMSSNPAYSFLSSSIVKEVARHGGNVTGMVPQHVLERLAQRFAANAREANAGE